MGTTDSMNARDFLSRRFSIGMLVVLLALTLGLGCAFAYWRRCDTDARLRTELLTQARMVANAVSDERITSLSGSSADLDSSDYRYLKEQLTRTRAANRQCRFLYLLGERRDALFFFVDSERIDSADYSPPGEAYAEAPEAMRGAFDSGMETVVGPYHDRWGTWITALIPLNGRATGDVPVFLGMDVDARDWGELVNEAYQPALLISLLFALVLTLFFMFLRRSEDALQRIAASEKALRQNEEKFSTAFHANAALMAISTIEGGRFIDINHAFLQTLGYSRDEVIGHTSSELGMFPCPEEREAVRCLFDNMGQAWNREAHIRGKDGVVHDGLFSASSVFVGEQRCWLTVMTDITDLRRAQEERERLETQLRQAQKMEAVGQLAGGVAHDFNNLLQVILGHVEIVQNELGSDSSQSQTLDEVRTAAERAANLTRQLLAFSRRQIIQPLNVDLNELIRGLLKMIRPVIGEHIELCFFPSALSGIVHVDKGQIEQVLMNLCVNARDAMPRGGMLTIATENVTACELDSLEPPPFLQGRYVLLKVADTGSGMDEVTRSQIFEPFFTTKGLGHGTGLGLATVYGIVKQHGGFVCVDSFPGTGTTFRVYFPAVDGPAEVLESTHQLHAPGGTETILVAEDDEMVRNLLAGILRSAGYSVIAVRDGEEAVRITKQQADGIDLALLDVIMPKLSGPEAMQRITAIRPAVCFLFSTGYSDDAFHANFVVKEGFRLVRKPYYKDELLRAVRDALDAGPMPEQK